MKPWEITWTKDQWYLDWGNTKMESIPVVSCRVGEIWEFEATVTDDSDDPVDLNYFTARVAMKMTQDETTEYILSPVVVNCIGEGKISGTIPVSITSTISPGTYIEELIIESQDGAITKRYQRKRRVFGRIITT